MVALYVLDRHHLLRRHPAIHTTKPVKPWDDGEVGDYDDWYQTT